jgi:hypothetical protein
MNSRTSTIATLSLALLGQLCLAGCMEEFDPPSLVDKTRPLGAEVLVDGDPARATPRPGETATVTWLMAAPGDLPELGWFFAVCPAGTGSQAESCAAAPLAVAGGQGTPSFQLAVPTEDVLGGTQRLTVYGQICQDGMPALDPTTGLPSCAGAGTTVTTDIWLLRQEPANHNPALAARPFWFDGVDWSGDAGLDCSGLPVVAAGSKGHVIALRTLAEDREATLAADGTATRETLQISHFTTAGALSRSYSFVETDDQSPTNDLDMKWDAPEIVPVDGKVRFTFVARDMRGGLGYATRTVCVRSSME